MSPTPGHDNVSLSDTDAMDNLERFINLPKTPSGADVFNRVTNLLQDTGRTVHDSTLCDCCE